MACCAGTLIQETDSGFSRWKKMPDAVRMIDVLDSVVATVSSLWLQLQVPASSIVPISPFHP